MSRGDVMNGLPETLTRFMARPEPALSTTVCRCGARLAMARVYGDSVELAFEVDDQGEPCRVRRGEFVVLAARRDALGRRPLIVVPVEDRRGVHVEHRLTCPSRLAAAS